MPPQRCTVTSNQYKHNFALYTHTLLFATEFLIQRKTTSTKFNLKTFHLFHNRRDYGSESDHF